MTQTTKQVGQYSQEQTSQVLELYSGGASVEFIAEMLGKSVRSVVAKLSREGVYKAKAKALTSTQVRKSDLIAAIAAKTGQTGESLESLEKATKEALVVIHSYICQDVA
jgi:hypothetical protein